MRTPQPRHGLAQLLVALAAAGCGSEPAATVDTTTSGLSLPTDVARVLQTRCVTCHSATPMYGAPMALTSYAATQAMAVSAPARPVWRLMGERVHDPVRPMPATRLPDDELAVIDRWVAAGAPGCSGSSCGTVTTDPALTSPSSRLPCAPASRAVFVSHAAGSTDRFRVAGASGNTNKCFAFRSSFRAGQQATAFAARVDQSRVLHHLILFGTDAQPGAGDVFDCDGNMPRDARFIAGWAPGNEGSVLPQDVGLELPDSTGWFILQVHYWNTTPDAADDASGMEMCITDTPRAHAASVHTLGSLNLALPPRTQGIEVVGGCTPDSTEPVHILGSTAHMHRLGVAMRTEVFRGGDTARMEPLMDVPSYSFDSQVSHPSEMVLMPGDTLRTTCRYNNTTSQTVYFGERTEDEMCFNFVLAWPAGALSNAGGRAARRCIGRAP